MSKIRMEFVSGFSFAANSRVPSVFHVSTRKKEGNEEM